MQIHFPVEKEGKAGKLFGILLVVIMIASGFLAAWLLCKVNHIGFGLYTWPLVACVDVFVFSTVGFFSTEGKIEVVYGACSILSAVCTLVQMALIF